jgi:hypothetical protein
VRSTMLGRSRTGRPPLRAASRWRADAIRAAVPPARATSRATNVPGGCG